MRVTIALLLLINACLLNAKSLPSVIENPCTEENLLRLQFYYPCPDDETKFIECNPWGMMSVKQCPEGTKWNTWLSSCVVLEPITDAPKNESDKVPSGPFCTYYGNSTCKNSGICNQMLMESKCFCQVGFTGDYCERSMVESTGAFGQLINSTFSIDLYKKQRVLENETLSINTTFDMSLVKNDLVKQRIQKYLDMYPKDEMRFDVLINYLVQDILTQLYPSSFFLREFALQSEIQMGYESAIPNLLQTAKYAYDRYDEFFTIYEQVLNNLVDYLPKHLTKIRDEAQSFFEVYDLLFTKFATINNITVHDTMVKRTELTRDEMKEEIHQDFNTTLSYAFDLFRLLNVFDDELSVKSEKLNAEETQYAIGNFSVHPEVKRILGEAFIKNTEIWDSLSFYGFWYVISSYVTLPDVNGISKRPYILDDEKMRPVAGALVGDEDDAVDFVPDGEVLVEKLVSGSTVLPKSGALESESTTRTIPRAGSLVGETTIMPKVDKLVDESTTPIIPRVGSLVSETTVMPKVDRLVDESTTPMIPRAGSLVSETTVMPKVDRLVDESTTPIISRVGSLVSETTPTPRVGALLDEKSTIIPPHVGAFRWEQ